MEAMLLLLEQCGEYGAVWNVYHNLIYKQKVLYNSGYNSGYQPDRTGEIENGKICGRHTA